VLTQDPRAIAPLQRAGAVDEVVSADGAGFGTGFGPCLGRGDALWRALAASTGELVVVADVPRPRSAARRAAGGSGDRVRQGRAGRRGPVAELVARPLLNLTCPSSRRCCSRWQRRRRPAARCWNGSRSRSARASTSGC
jgi:hypothetical protein